MKKQTLRLPLAGTVLALVAGSVLASDPAFAAPGGKPVGCGTYETCSDLGALAYVYGYPLVIMGVSAQVATNVPDATSTRGRAPINQFSNNGLPDETYIDIVLPSVSTPYSNAILDLTKEPVVMHLPDMGDRFFLMQVLDFWTNSAGEDPGCQQGAAGFCAVGSRYGTQGGDYAFVGPDWKGTLPPGIRQVITMPTNNVLIAGRTFTDGSPADLEVVTAIQANYTLTPLGKYGKGYRPPTHGPVDPNVDMATGPRDQVAKMDAGAFFKSFAELMRKNPPLPDDTAVLAAIARIGIVPGQPFDIRRLDPTSRSAVEDGYAKAQQFVAEESTKFSPTSTNWNMSLDLGAWGRRYLLRAAVAYGALGANLYADAVYAGALKDADGALLSGDHAYTMHFDADKMPPVDARGFWSVTLYNRPAENLYGNPDHFYALGIPAAQGRSIRMNLDASLDLYIQHDAPPDQSSTQYANWIPSPPPGKGYLLLMRLYWPTDALFKKIGAWVPPAVQMVGP